MIFKYRSKADIYQTMFQRWFSISIIIYSAMHTASLYQKWPDVEGNWSDRSACTAHGIAAMQMVNLSIYMEFVIYRCLCVWHTVSLKEFLNFPSPKVYSIYSSLLFQSSWLDNGFYRVDNLIKFVYSVRESALNLHILDEKEGN
jgi:hypothetical protein